MPNYIPTDGIGSTFSYFVTLTSKKGLPLRGVKFNKKILVT